MGAGLMGGNGMGPAFSLVMVAVVLLMGASNWRQKKIKRAVRDLPTKLRRQLGAAPGYSLPQPVPADFDEFVALNRRVDRVFSVIKWIAVIWLAFVVYLEFGASL